MSSQDGSHYQKQHPWCALESYITRFFLAQTAIELGQRTFRNGRWGMRTITSQTLKMLQVRANRMCSCISFFVSKKVRKIRAFFLILSEKIPAIIFRDYILVRRPTSGFEKSVDIVG